MDFKRIAGVDGIYVANTWSSQTHSNVGVRAVTKISYDKGGAWTDINGPVDQGVPGSLLHVSGPGEADESNNFFYSHEHAPGIFSIH
jgi:hypothetical protein